MTDAILTGAGQFFSAFNILGLGVVAIWIVGSLILGNIIGAKKDERTILSIILLASGGILIFASDPSQFVILIVSVIVILFGVFKLLWSNKNE